MLTLCLPSCVLVIHTATHPTLLRDTTFYALHTLFWDLPTDNRRTIGCDSMHTPHDTCLTTLTATCVTHTYSYAAYAPPARFAATLQPAQGGVTTHTRCRAVRAFTNHNTVTTYPTGPDQDILTAAHTRLRRGTPDAAAPLQHAACAALRGWMPTDGGGSSVACTRDGLPVPFTFC